MSEATKAAPASHDAEPFDYLGEFQRIGLMLPLAAEINIEALEDHLTHYEAVAPILEPTAYIRGGADNLSEQRALLNAIKPFVRYARQLAAKAAEIDRGLSYVCGSEPYGGERGCGACERLRNFGVRRHHHRGLTGWRPFGQRPPQ